MFQPIFKRHELRRSKTTAQLQHFEIGAIREMAEDRALRQPDSSPIDERQALLAIGLVRPRVQSFLSGATRCAISRRRVKQKVWKPTMMSKSPKIAGCEISNNWKCERR